MLMPILCIEQIIESKRLGVICNSNLHFSSHVNLIRKQCSQCSFSNETTFEDSSVRVFGHHSFLLEERPASKLWFLN